MRKIKLLHFLLLHQIENDETEKAVSLVPCEFCDFCAKNERGLKLHIKARHEITKVEISAFVKQLKSILALIEIYFENNWKKKLMFLKI